MSITSPALMVTTTRISTRVKPPDRCLFAERMLQRMSERLKTSHEYRDDHETYGTAHRHDDQWIEDGYEALELCVHLLVNQLCSALHAFRQAAGLVAKAAEAVNLAW